MTTPNRQPKLIHVRNPLKRVSVTFEPTVPLEGPVTDGPLIRVGSPLKRLRLTLEPVTELFDLRELHDAANGVGPIDVRVRRWCEEQWGSEEQFVTERLPLVRDQIRHDRATTDWYMLVRALLVELDVEIHATTDVSATLRRLPSLQYVTREVARMVFVRRTLPLIKGMGLTAPEEYLSRRASGEAVPGSALIQLLNPPAF